MKRMTLDEVLSSPHVSSATKGRVSQALGLNGLPPASDAEQGDALAQAKRELEAALTSSK